MAGNRYLFLRLSALGDILFALEALSALKEAEPEARVDWLVEDRGQALLSGHPLLDRVLVYPRQDLQRMALRPWLWPSLLIALVGHVRTLRSQRYDAALDLHGNLKSGLHLFLCRAQRKLGFAAPRAKEGSSLAAGEHVRLTPHHTVDGQDGMVSPHRATEGLLLVQQLLGKTVATPVAPFLQTIPSAVDAARGFLASHPSDTGPVICLIPGTSEFAAFKRWPTSAFARLADLLHASGFRVVIGTGPGEEPLAQAIQRETAIASCLHANGAELGLDSYLALLAEVDLVVAADSGPLHMAQALGTRAVALFGPKDPAVYGPRLEGSRVLRYPVPCAPCGRRSCDAPLCVQAIPPEAVLSAVSGMLSTTNKGPAS